MGRIKTRRVKHGSLWVSVYAENLGFGTNLGLVIYKSKRASNEWYARRRTRRARRAAGLHGGATLQHWAAGRKLIVEALNQDTPVFVYLQQEDRRPLARYLERFGFVEVTCGIWVYLQLNNVPVQLSKAGKHDACS